MINWIPHTYDLTVDVEVSCTTGFIPVVTDESNKRLTVLLRGVSIKPWHTTLILDE